MKEGKQSSRKTWYQQGDVLLFPVDGKIDKAGYKRKDSPVLARGEATGHAHEITSGEVVLLEKNADDMILEVLSEAATLTHHAPGVAPVKPDSHFHRPVELPAGTYRVQGVKTYDHFKEEARRAAD